MDEIWNLLFTKIVSDDSIKDTRGKLQMQLIMEKGRAKKAGTLDEFYASLVKRFPMYLEEQEEEEAEEVEQEEEDQPQPVRSAKTLTTGDCFYSSIYRAAYQQNALQQIRNCLDFPEEEMGFIRAFRTKLAKEILAGRLPKDFDPRNRKEKDFYEGLKEAIAAKAYGAALQAFPAWFQSPFAKGLPPRTIFLQILAKGVSTMTNWVSEIEVRMVEEILRGCGVLLEKHNHDIPFAQKTKDGLPLLNLHNKGEYHWEYFSFVLPAGYTNSKEFLRKVEEETEREERGVAVREEMEQHYLEGLKAGTAEVRKSRGGYRVTRKKRPVAPLPSA